VNKVGIWITKFEGNDTFSMMIIYGKHFQLLTGLFSYSLIFFQLQLQLQLFFSSYSYSYSYSTLFSYSYS